ncbi:probable magnesium transporter NIPA9 isoform X2 [Cryptomeria japonica]|nr:probable magnesium transporter NIPA9 isoform X2 [Cryptomeria japonica]
MRAYALSKTWVAGFCIDILGALLMLRAVSQAPVSVIQPVSGCGLAVLSMFSHFYLKETMNPLDWLGIAMAGVGTIGVGIIGEEQETSTISFLHLAWLIISIIFLFGLLNGWLSLRRRKRRAQELTQTEVVEEIIAGLEAGILFGLAAAISRMGFLLSEQGFSKMSIPVGIAISICCSGSGFFYQTKGLKHGRAIVVSTCAAVSSIVTGVVVGMFALGEMLPVAPFSRILLVLGWSLIIIGVVVLMSSHRLTLLLPRSFRRPMHGKLNVHKTSNLPRPGSSRLWESSPSTFISMSPMHLHPQASPGKVKT